MMRKEISIMKILKLKIVNKEKQTIRNVIFNPIGLSVILGETNLPYDTKNTSNSIGKTIFLKLIDYIYGAKEDATIIKPKIHGWEIVATVQKNKTVSIVRRVLGKSHMYINDKVYTLEKYRKYFDLDRNKINKQIFVRPKHNIISQRADASLHDFQAFFQLLGFEDIISHNEIYYVVQDQLKGIKKLEKQIKGFYKGYTDSEIEKEIFLIKQEILLKVNELNTIDSNLNSIDLQVEKDELIKIHTNKNKIYKDIKKNSALLELEKKRLQDFVEQSDKKDISSDHIHVLFKKAQVDIPDLIKKRIEEVEKFHRTIFMERKELVRKKVMQIDEEIVQHKIEMNNIITEMKNLEQIIAENNYYKETIEIYKLKNVELQELKYKQGELSKVEEIINERENLQVKLTSSYNTLKEHFDYEKKHIELYRDFIFHIVNNIYQKDKVHAYFNIELRNKHQTARPFKVELSLTGDAGEGVGEVKKILIDFLIFNYNTYMNLMVQDSSCFSGVDYRQVTNLIKEATLLAETTGKQYICSISDFQVNREDLSFMHTIKSHSVLTLNEHNKLLGFDFD
ncbi:hypothetical protein CN907_01655 [Bacillus anthracis]|nr:hypothetical protein CN907_01655 [Bacillus anthracis]